MNEPMVLVDSSVWIHFIDRGPADPFYAPMVALLKDTRVATNWLIRIEVLSGTLTEDIYRMRDVDLSALRQLELTEAVYQSASVLRWQLLRRGATIPVVDTLIAACAIYYGCSLLHDDQHFRLIARHAPLRLHPSAHTRS